MQPKQIVAALFISAPLRLSSQTYHIDLSERIAQPDIHTIFFTAAPRETLHLPAIDKTGAMFFSLWYCQAPTDDEDISFMAF